MSVSEAYDVLGLPEGTSLQQVLEAHRRLIQKLHPDRGGSNFLAAQINLAKDVLSKHLA
jgi:curved DNA-binding protein CbpA